MHVCLVPLPMINKKKVDVAFNNLQDRNLPWCQREAFIFGFYPVIVRRQTGGSQSYILHVTLCGRTTHNHGRSAAQPIKQLVWNLFNTREKKATTGKRYFGHRCSAVSNPQDKRKHRVTGSGGGVEGSWGGGGTISEAETVHLPQPMYMKCRLLCNQHRITCIFEVKLNKIRTRVSFFF